MSPGMTLNAVQAVLILGTEDGARIFAKYYSSPHGTELPSIPFADGSHSPGED